MSWVLFLSGFTLFLTSLSIRHYWFQTSAWDLGIFDQAIYLISEGLAPISSLLDFHILGDHGALVLYPIALLNKLIPSIYLLFIIQSASLASGVFPLERIGKRKGLSRSAIFTSQVVLILYPIVFNVAIFDFHPEVIAFPIILEILNILEDRNRRNNNKLFLLIFFTLTCKISMSLLMLGIGVWLILKKEKSLGIKISILSFASLIFLGCLLIPFFGGESASITRHLDKFGGNNLNTINLFSLEFIVKIILQVFSLENIEYIILIFLPVTYLLFHNKIKKILFIIIPFSPLFFINILSINPALKDLIHQYSLFLVPFICVAVQDSLVPSINGINGYPKFAQRKIKIIIISWTIISFLFLSRIFFFFGPFHEHFDTTKSRREAINLIPKTSSVLTTNDLVPHLSRRRIISITNYESLDEINTYEYILLDIDKPGWSSSKELLKEITDKIKSSKRWEIIYSNGPILLYKKNIS